MVGAEGLWTASCVVGLQRTRPLGGAPRWETTNNIAPQLLHLGNAPESAPWSPALPAAPAPTALLLPAYHPHILATRCCRCCCASQTGLGLLMLLCNPEHPPGLAATSHATHTELASDHRELSAACMPSLIPPADTLQAAILTPPPLAHRWGRQCRGVAGVDPSPLLLPLLRVCWVWRSWLQVHTAGHIHQAAAHTLDLEPGLLAWLTAVCLWLGSEDPIQPERLHSCW